MPKLRPLLLAANRAYCVIGESQHCRKDKRVNTAVTVRHIAAGLTTILVAAFLIRRLEAGNFAVAQCQMFGLTASDACAP